MSFVGPRPELVKEFTAKFSDFQKRFVVTLGLTSIARVYRQYDTPPQHKFKYDLLYINMPSISRQT